MPNLFGFCAALTVLAVLGSFVWGVIGILNNEPVKWIVLRVAPVFLCFLYFLAMAFSEVK